MANHFLDQPTIVAASVAAAVAVITLAVNAFLNTNLHQDRLKMDMKLAERRFEFDLRLLRERAEADMALAERRFEFEQQLTKQKLASDKAAKIWQQKVEFSGRALTEFYEARSRLNHVRSPFSPGNESEGRKGRDAEDPDTQRIRDGYFPVIKRIADNANFFNSMFAERFKAIALFGVEASDPYDQIWSIIVDVQTAAETLVWHYSSLGSRTHLHDESIKMLKGKIWSAGARGDEVAENIRAAVSSAESLFGPSLRGGKPT